MEFKTTTFLNENRGVETTTSAFKFKGAIVHTYKEPNQQGTGQETNKQKRKKTKRPITTYQSMNGWGYEDYS